MSSFLQNLENNEAILLMYLANELPAPDREEVEAMLKHDANLRAQFNALRAAYHRFDQMMLLGDTSNVLPSGYMSAQVFGRTVRERFAAQQRSVDDHEDGRRRMHWAIYPVAAAAVLAIGMLFWWKSASDDMSKPAMMVSTESRGFDGWNGRRGTGGVGRGYDRWQLPMVDFSSVAAGNPAELPDETLEASFDPIVLPRYSGAQRQLAVLDYLDQTWQ